MKIKINPIDGAEMVWVSAGAFLMGLSREQVENYCRTMGTDPSSMEIMRPQRLVYLDAYWIYRTPVTFGQFRRFCAINRKQAVPINRVSRGTQPVLEMDDSYPVTRVTWTTARAYCQWAQAQLPTEAQWEKAARGESGQLYPWGDAWNPDCANFVRRDSADRMGRPAPADAYTEGASPCGALQMSGNIKEWCQDLFAPYGYEAAPFRNLLEYWRFRSSQPLHDQADAPITNPTGPQSGFGRVVRGGGWGNGNGHWAGLAAYRGSERERDRHDDLGFRPVAPCADQERMRQHR
jgi:formylglycine-generating enzyme required for sulfatase activity